MAGLQLYYFGVAAIFHGVLVLDEESWFGFIVSLCELQGDRKNSQGQKKWKRLCKGDLS